MQVSDYVIGVDPDSDLYGVAIYYKKKLIELKSLSHYDLIGLIEDKRQDGRVIVSIENVMLNKFVYARNWQSSGGAMAKIGMGIGRCQHSQKVLMEWLDKLEIPYVLHKPQKGNWAKNKSSFEKVTGWDGRSNEDTRAAAFFGYLAL